MAVLDNGAAPPDQPPVLVNRIFPDRVLLPARNATMVQFASMMQRAVLVCDGSEIGRELLPPR